MDGDDLKPAKGGRLTKVRHGTNRTVNLIKYFKGLVAESTDDILPLFECMLPAVLPSHILRV